MEFLQTLSTVFYFDSGSFSIPLFVFSSLMLILGVTLQTRIRAIQLAAIENRPLSWIETTHPHLPSPRFIVSIALCSATLLLVSLQTLQHTFPFNDPYHGLNLASLFMLGGAIGILCETRWKGAKEYASALLSGTALAFLFIVIHYNVPLDSVLQKALLTALLMPSLLLVGYTQLQKRHHLGSLILILSTSAFWILVYTLQ